MGGGGGFIKLFFCLSVQRSVTTVQGYPYPIHVQWNLVIKRSDITKPSYNKVILLVQALYISVFLP